MRLTVSELRAKHRAIPKAEYKIADRFRVGLPFVDAVRRLCLSDSKPIVVTGNVFKDEMAAVEFIEAQRWGDRPRCPHCTSRRVVQMRAKDGTRNKRWLWRCKGCGRQYTAKIGTVMQDSHAPVSTWLRALYLACSSDGTTARDVMRHTGLTYKPALETIRALTTGARQLKPRAK